MKRSFAVTVAWAQTCKIWNKFDELFDRRTCQTLAFCAIYCGAIQTKKSRYVFREFQMHFQINDAWFDFIWSIGLGRKRSWRKFHVWCWCCISILANAWLGTDMPWSSSMFFFPLAFVQLRNCTQIGLNMCCFSLVFFFRSWLKVVEDGYEFFAKRQLVTLFSAPNYCGEFDNAGGMMTVDESLLCSFQVNSSHIQVYFFHLIELTVCFRMFISICRYWNHPRKRRNISTIR